MLIQSWLNSLLKFVFSNTGLAIAGLFVLFSLGGCDFFSGRILSETLVEVGGYKLTTKDFSKTLSSKLKTLDALSAKDPRVVAKFKDSIVADFIVESLILLWFEQNKISLTEKEIDEEVKSLTSSYPDDTSLRETLSSENISFSDWRKKVVAGLKRKKVFQLFDSQSTPPTEVELLSYYENNKSRFELKEAVQLSHIVVSDENQAEIVKKLTKSQKFSELIKKYSLASDSAFGGQFGWVERDAIPELDKAYRAKSGEILSAIKLSDGFHIFKVEQRRPQRIRSYAEAKEQVRAEVLALRETARFSAWLDTQIKTHRVLKNASLIDNIYVETR